MRALTQHFVYPFNTDKIWLLPEATNKYGYLQEFFMYIFSAFLSTMINHCIRVNSCLRMFEELHRELFSNGQALFIFLN